MPTLTSQTIDAILALVSDPAALAEHGLELARTTPLAWMRDGLEDRGQTRVELRLLGGANFGDIELSTSFGSKKLEVSLSWWSGKAAAGSTPWQAFRRIDEIAVAIRNLVEVV